MSSDRFSGHSLQFAATPSALCLYRFRATDNIVLRLGPSEALDVTDVDTFMKSDGNIPAPAVRRLSLYLRQLEVLWGDDRQKVSSKELGKALRLTDSQIRKDLAYFGQFGQAGVGYDIAELTTNIRKILGTDRTWNVLLVGAGNLGSALSAYRGFAKKGFRLVAVFDSDRKKVGKPLASNPELIVQHIDELESQVKQREIHLAINAVPADAAQQIAHRLVKAGVKGLFNFAPVNLDVDSDVAVSSVDLAVQLEQLSFQVSMTQSFVESEKTRRRRKKQ